VQKCDDTYEVILSSLHLLSFPQIQIFPSASCTLASSIDEILYIAERSCNVMYYLKFTFYFHF